MSKLTKAQKEFLVRHPDTELLAKSMARKTYDFIGKLRDLGLIEIDNGDKMGWPWLWAGTRLTDAGRAAKAPPPQKTMLEASNG